MKNKTMWRRCYPNIIGKEFYDGGEYGLGFFTVLKAWKCKEYCKSAEALDGTHWFDKRMILVKTDTGLKYKLPYLPWLKSIVEEKTRKKWIEFYDEQPW